MLSSPALTLRRLPAAIALYTALGLSANLAAPALAQADMAAVAALREGDMRKLSFHESPRPVPEATLLDADDGTHGLADWHGKWVVLNFWATWCPPCLHEMPSLDRLQQALGGDDLAVVPVATGRNPVPAIRRFFDEAGLQDLPILRDPTQRLSRGMGVLGLPVTVILNPDGDEVARMTGDAEWDSPSARAILAALMAGP